MLLGKASRNGMVRANHTPGCLLSRGGPVSSRRNRNLGKSKQGARVGPLIFCLHALFPAEAIWLNQQAFLNAKRAFAAANALRNSC